MSRSPTDSLWIRLAILYTFIQTMVSMWMTDALLLQRALVIMAPLAACVYLVWATRHHEAPNRTFWLLIIMGLLLDAVARWISSGNDGVVLAGPSEWNAENILWSTSVVMFAVAIIYLFRRAQGLLRGMRFTLDMVIICVTFLTVGWEYMTIPELSEGVVPTVWRALWIDILHFVCICVLLFFIWVLYYKTKQLTKQTALYLCLGGSFYIAGTLLHIYLGGFMHVDIGSYLYPLHSLSVFFVALAGGQHIQAKERLLQERRSRPLGTLLVKYVLPYSVLSFMFVLLAQRFGGWNSLFTGLSLCVVLILVRQVLIQIENDRLLEQLHSSFKQSESLAHRDDLTGLYNRRYFNAQLSRSLHRADRAGSRVALLYMDLNRFKSVNDRYGHRTGDLLIQKVAQRLQSLESKGILVSRLGGDEFTVMICPAGEDQELIWMAEEIWILLSEPYDLEGHDIRTSPSIGIAVYPDHAKNDQELIGRADAAMYAAKERHARWHFDVEQTMMLQLLEQKLD